MDPKMVRMAKEIPARLKEVMNSMFEASEPALRSGVSTLRQSLSRLDSYLADVEKEHLGSPSRGGRARASMKGSAAGASAGKARRRRGGKRFGTGDFILEQLRSHPEGMRPRDLAEALRNEAPGQHKSPISIVNTTLARQAGAGQVRKLAPGLWASGTGSKASTKRGTKSGKKRTARKKSNRSGVNAEASS